jgi:hypothetical protein
MEAKHTPTPWQEGTRGPNNCPIIGHKGLMIAMLTNGIDFQETTDANAEFIIRAVNGHDALVLALKRCLIRIEEECADPEHLDCVISAKEVLALAGEKP